MKLPNLAAFCALVILASTTHAMAVTLVDDNTLGYYNDSIGTVLAGKDPAFQTTTDRPMDFTVAPNLSAAKTQLGGWLQRLPSLNPQYWTTTPVAVPAQWAVNSETAIVYKIDVPPSGYTNIVMQFGVDNGVFVWLDGRFLGGAERPGGAVLGEHTYKVASLAAGTHYIQVLREDHGVTNDYLVKITGEGAMEKRGQK